ncbi:MAG: LysE family translocator [Paracoccaceae bacterium]
MIVFAFAVFFLIITPGPGVLSTAGVGTAYGFKSGIRYVFGLFLGTNLVALLVISGLSSIIFSYPMVRTICLFLSSIFFIYLSLKIMFKGANLNFLKSKSIPGIKHGIILQLINPKAYIVNLSFYSGFAFYPSNFLIEILLKLLISNLIWVPIHLIWLYAGVLFYELPLSKTFKNIVRYFMGISLILVVILSLASV